MRKTGRLLVAAALMTGTLAIAAPGWAGEGDVCPEHDLKVEVEDGIDSIEVDAPEGFLIAGYCVKAGSAKQGLGPVFIPVDPPQESVTIEHPSGKDISHYSLVLVEDEGPSS